MRSTLLALALLAALAPPGPVAGAANPEGSPFTADGWYTWRVAAVDDAPRWCCLDWVGGRAVPKTCELDDGHFSFGDDLSRLPAADEVQLYALARKGELRRVRALSPACPVNSPAERVDLGRVDAAASLTWLQPLARDEDSDALAAVAVHRGPEALGILTGFARGDYRMDLREEAAFWLGQVRIGEARDTLAELMFEDPDPEMRGKAAFSIAQSEAPDRAGLLIRQGREDPVAEVRGEAWFWLAESGTADAESVLFEALRAEADQEVREDIVFALSQLPDERAVASLVRIVQDAGMAHELREQALFWLVESDAEEAYEFIDRLFSAAAAREASR